MNKERHRSVYRALPFVFYREGSYKYIFSYLIDAYSEDTGNTGCLCGGEPGSWDRGRRRLSTIHPFVRLNFEP